MNKIDIKGWKEFAMPDIGFKNYHGKRLKKSDRIEGNVPFITAGKENQGVVGTIGNDRKTYENPITIDMFGNVFYHEGYYAGDDNVYFFVNPTINKACKLFIVSSLQSSIHALFAYVDQFRQDNADSLTVFLPADLDGTPDWQYMENYIQQIEQNQRNNLQIINKLSPPMHNSLNKNELAKWCLFKVGELFDIHPTKAYKLTNKDLFVFDGINPVVVNSSYNNGIGGYTKFPTTENGGIITFSDTTTADSIFYQMNDFVGYPHVQGMYPIKYLKKWNQLSMLFFCTVFRQTAIAQGFDYGNKFTREIAKTLMVALPVKEDNTPDWHFMEQYISDLLQKKITVLKQLS